MAQNNFEDSTSLMPNDYTCIVCSTPETRKKQLAKHIKVRNRCTKFRIALLNTVLRLGYITVFLLRDFGRLRFLLEAISLAFQIYFTTKGNLAKKLYK